MSQILNKLVKEFKERENRGFDKYGTTMDRLDLSLQNWVQHALEEAMDLSLYLYKIKTILNDTQGYSNYKKASPTTNVSSQPNRKAKHIGTPVRKIQKTKLQGSGKRNN